MPKSPNTPSPKSKPEELDAPKGDRLQKILAQAGIASRRKAEEIILEGRVQVNGTTITELGTRADLGPEPLGLELQILGDPAAAPGTTAPERTRDDSIEPWELVEV